MEIGELVSVAPPAPPPPPDTEFAAELVSVTFKSGVKTSHAQAEVTPPHWEAGKEAAIEDDWTDMAKKLGLPAAPYSKRVAVYLVKGKAGASYDVEVKLKVTKSKNVSGDGKLRGNFNGLSIEGTCPTGTGEHTVVATITEPPETIQSYRGKIGWGIEVDSASLSVELGTTLAEIYFILGKPTAPYSADGVWAEVLRFLCGKVGVVGQNDGKDAAQKITTYCHSAHGLRYDTDHGASHYGVGPLGGDFELKDYIARGIPSCNCYDQAAAVQALSGALGVSVGWRYLRPFGYIKPTNLVGVGQCNNPFFGSDDSKKLVAVDSPDRTAFGNHAFASAPSKNILDACAGPHTPLESVRTHFDEVGEHRLEVLSIQPLTATYKAKEPGQARIDIPVVDRKTLLSPPLSVTVDILPAR
jgi:hypothetical protein